MNRECLKIYSLKHRFIGLTLQPLFKKYMIRYLLISFSLLFFSSETFAQTGGQHVFEFLNLSPSARNLATGGRLIDVMDADPSFGYLNPSLDNESMDNRISFNYAPYLAGINFGYAGYAKTFDSIRTTFDAGVQFISYGSFQGTDEFGNLTNTFSGGEYSIHVGGAYHFGGNFYAGANLNFITSHLESYSSSGLAFSFAGTYYNADKGFTATVLFRNVGLQFKDYLGGKGEPIPFDIQAGISKRLEHTPFLFSLVLHDLYHFDIRYNDPNEQQNDNLFLDSSQSNQHKNYIGDKILLHCIFSTEIFIGKSVRLDVGYNHQQRQELAFDARKGMAGFSMGAGVHIYRFNFDYAHNWYNIAGGINEISLGLNLNEWFGKRM